MFRLQEADLGFHLIIDRRNDKWNSVKTVLLKISVSEFNTLHNNYSHCYHFIKLRYLTIIYNNCYYKFSIFLFQAFFPGLVHVVYVLRPAGFLQKAISEVSNKLFREDFKFRVIFLANIAELHEFIEKDQLTEPLDGNLPYCHHTWIQNRIVNTYINKNLGILIYMKLTFLFCLY